MAKLGDLIGEMVANLIEQNLEPYWEAKQKLNNFKFEEQPKDEEVKEPVVRYIWLRNDDESNFISPEYPTLERIREIRKEGQPIYKVTFNPHPVFELVEE